MDDLVKAAVREVEEKYHPHTIIVYGSRARNDATATSDIDIACFCDKAEIEKDARDFQGVFLDAWVYQTESMQADKDEFLKLGDGFCALDTRGLGEDFLTQIRERIDQGPQPLSDEDKLHAVEWVKKMLKRIEQDDLEGLYRKLWLQVDLLEILFQLRGHWYFGPKKSFARLEKEDPVGCELFQASYRNPNDLDALTKLANYVTEGAGVPDGNKKSPTQ
ncbi:nucleotidyltransferase domain-containing protein [Endozoicomonas arenosclerae]|uniref:nucleotidyltransferase domain-containing protein n=1 Tax=Endozoicomonas arenosclerae TaxID=1633495 RepID=UPI00078542F7|nr:nucleotidyltransferase domain-containing protein [Endozoicomonas arenosclerae]